MMLDRQSTQLIYSTYQMPNLATLRSHTTAFFALHWASGAMGSPPSWTDLFVAESAGPYQNYDCQGCYALFANSELRYIGVASSRGAGRYKGEAIGVRLKHVVAVDWKNKLPDGRRKYIVRDKWAGINNISTIGFPKATGYLAAALEHYLLGRPDLSSLANIMRPGCP